MTGGRKREFCKEAALEAAMQVFWQKGFQGASLSDLTQSMGINKPSMYSAFGNKEELFLKATDHYIKTIAKVHVPFLSMPDTQLAVRLKRYLMSVVSEQCSAAHPKGCYIVFTVTEAASGGLPDDARDLVLGAAQYITDLLTNLFRCDPEAKEAGLSHRAGQHALSLATTIHGTATMARSGKTAEELEPVIDNALRGLGLQAE